jgi:allantoicase
VSGLGLWGWSVHYFYSKGLGWGVDALIDTAHYKGNYPDGAALRAADLSDFQGDVDRAVVTSAMFWPVLLERQQMTADAEHTFGPELADLGPVTHVRLDIFPDGGVSRLRLWGRRA